MGGPGSLNCFALGFRGSPSRPGAMMSAQDLSRRGRCLLRARRTAERLTPERLSHVVESIKAPGAHTSAVAHA